jgi:hypothetical protein
MKYLIPLVFLGLAACDAALPGMEPAVDLCQAPAYQGVIGQNIDALDDWLLVQHPYRVIRPGDAVTEDFNPNRLNIRLDGADRVVAVDCG